ncbi:Uncharacterised protein [Serratia ficaria]|nr:Uncharacterised protein [Serratia ficaria]
MRGVLYAVLLTVTSLTTVAATSPDGKTEKPFVIDNEVICLNEIQQRMTPFLKIFEEENGVLYKYTVKSGLSYKDTIDFECRLTAWIQG